MNSSATVVSPAEQFLTYSSYGCVIFGLISNLVNILVFRMLSLFRRNPSSFYLSIESFVNCFVLTIFHVPRILKHGGGYDPWSSSVAFCKIMGSLNPIVVLISLTTVCFASMDQYLSTSYRLSLRRISTIELAHRLTEINVIVWIGHGFLFFIYLDIGPLTECEIHNQLFRVYYTIGYLFLLNGLTPMIVSGSLSALAFYNVRHLIRLRLPVVRRRLDQQITAMILIRVAFLLIVSIPFGLCLIYTQNTAPMDPYSSEGVRNTLILAVTGNFFSLNYAVSYPFGYSVTATLIACLLTCFIRRAHVCCFV